MKKAILGFTFILVAILLLIGAVALIGNKSSKKSYVLPQLEKSYVIYENQGKTTEKQKNTNHEKPEEILIRSFSSGFSPDTITLEKGKKYLLIVADSSCRQKSRFMVYGLRIDEYYTKGGIIYIAVAPEKKGTFYFGDDSAKGKHGTINVI